MGGRTPLRRARLSWLLSSHLPSASRARIPPDGDLAFLGVVAGHVIFFGQFALIGWGVRTFKVRT